MNLYFIVARISIAVLFTADVLLLLYFIDFIALTTMNEQQKRISVLFNKTREYENLKNFNKPEAKKCKDKKVRLLHIINPFHSQDITSVLSQNMTLFSISNALQHKWEKCGDGDLLVNVLALFSPDDYEAIRNSNLKIPAHFIIRSFTRDTIIMKGPPLLRTILSHGFAFAREENFTHVIFSNVDINVVPSFYESVSYLLNCSDTLLINRWY